MTQCQSCQEQNARYLVTLTNLRSEVLDTAALCLDCLTTAKLTDVLAPGADHEEPGADHEDDDMFTCSTCHETMLAWQADQHVCNGAHNA